MEAVEELQLSDCEDETFYANVPTTKLVDGINIQELISTQQATFEINTNVEEALEQQEGNLYDSEKLLECINLDCMYISDSESEDGVGDGLVGTPFGKIARSMIDILPDGKVKKKMKQEGTGPVIPNDALVWINYNAYVEYGDEPFDSTYLRGRTTKVRLGQGKLIQGLEVGITTMKVYEKALFLIHPDLAYGKFGVPPRIPPNAEVLFLVELKKAVDNAAVAELEELTEEQQREVDFTKMYKASEALVVKGNEQFKKGNYPKAIHNYKKAVRLMEFARMDKEEQQEKQQKLLGRLYVNLAVCYNKTGAPKAVCRYCQNALSIDPRNTKALYNYADAQMKLAGFSEAKSLALRARSINPHNPDINKLLEKLNSKMKKYQDDSALLARKAFQMMESEKKSSEVNDCDIDENFKETVQIYLKEFLEDENQKTLSLPSLGMTKKEERFLKEAAEKLGLTCQIADNGQMYIRKPKTVG